MSNTTSLFVGSVAFLAGNKKIMHGFPSYSCISSFKRRWWRVIVVSYLTCYIHFMVSFISCRNFYSELALKDRFKFVELFSRWILKGNKNHICFCIYAELMMKYKISMKLLVCSKFFSCSLVFMYAFQKKKKLSIFFVKLSKAKLAFT